MRQVKLSELEGLVGQELGVSQWISIDQERVNRFAEATEDFQWIHLDTPRSRSELGGPIAHGYLILSLVPRLVYDVVEFVGIGKILNYGADNLRFTAPVKVGSKVRMRMTVADVSNRGSAIRLTSSIRMEADDNPKPAVLADVILLLDGADERTSSPRRVPGTVS